MDVGWCDDLAWDGFAFGKPIAREMEFVGPWHLVADRSEADKAKFLEEYQTSKIESPLSHWLRNHNTPVRFRQAAYEHYHSPEQRRLRSERATQEKERAVSEALAMCEAGNVDGARQHLLGVGMEEEGVTLYLQSWL
jgi:hypothetical protein